VYLDEQEFGCQRPTLFVSRTNLNVPRGINKGEGNEADYVSATFFIPPQDASLHGNDLWR
jgi:hypothetical protein